MSIVHQLRQFVADSGKSQLEIQGDTGIPQPTLSKFMSGKRGLRLADIDKLAEYFGLELRPAKKPRAESRTGK